MITTNHCSKAFFSFFFLLGAILNSNGQNIEIDRNLTIDNSLPTLRLSFDKSTKGILTSFGNTVNLSSTVGGLRFFAKDEVLIETGVVTIRPSTSDDAVIQSFPGDVGGDIFLESNDAVVVRIDKNNNGQGNFFVWDDDGTNLFQVQQNGNVRVGGSLVHTSDRNRKRDISELDYGEILNEVLEKPIYQWRYKWEERTHLGPMAQDFYKAFALGDDDKVISALDADGVALAAIKAQQEIIEKQEDRISDLEKELLEIKRVLRKQGFYGAYEN